MATMTETSDEIREQLLEFRTKVVRADQALRCCRSAESRMQIDVLGAINQVIGFVANAQEGMDLALVPAPALVGLQTRLVSVAAGGPLAVGAVVLAGSSTLMRLATQTATLDVLDLVNTVVGQTLSNRKTHCYECLKKSLLNQKNPRHRETDKILRRVG